MFVLVGTAGAVESDFVRQEIDEFLKTGRTILPIGFGENFDHAVWSEKIPGLPIELERDDSAVTTGNPSPNVVAFVEKSFNYSRRDQIIRSERGSSNESRR